MITEKQRSDFEWGAIAVALLIPALICLWQAVHS